MAKRDYYEVLDLEKDATAEVIKKSFRSLARRHHPDKNPDDPDAETRFKEVQEAYAVLSDTEQRQRYDMFGHDQPGGGPFGNAGFEGFNISIEDLFGGGFDSLFSQMFGGSGAGGRGRGRQRRQRGEDVLARKAVPFEAAFDGSEHEVDVELMAECEGCDGLGAASADGIRTCPTCDGAGRIARTSRVGPFVQETVSDCPTCRGAGRTIQDPCSQCIGEGRLQEKRRIRFSVPRGAEDGMRLRMHGQGAAPPAGGSGSGNLYIELIIEDHKWFERSSEDLLMALPLGYPEFVLGTTIEVEHLDGKLLEIIIPAGSRPGDTLTISGRGMHPLRGRGRGDVTVLLKLHVPDEIDSETKNLVESLKDTLSIPDSGIEEAILDEVRMRRRGR
jgi:molecular chaperone DnaJ